MPFQTLKIFATFLLSFAILAGCSSVLRDPTKSSQELLQEAQGYLKVNNYDDARIVLVQLLEDYPDSKERPTALLLRSEIRYREKEFEEAKFHFKQFLRQYPAHPQADRALYLVGMSDFRLMDLETRDQTHARAALETFERLVREYPKSPYRKKVLQRKSEALDSLAKNQLEIGKFYFRTSSFQSAIPRFKELLSKYPSQKYEHEIIFLLGECYFNEQNFDSAKTYYIQLLKNHPRSEFVIVARARLRQIR